jgi:tRNA uridine 5-carbamoylmethylation protein Kti12
LDADNKALTAQIKNLAENIEILTKVTAIGIAKDELFKGKQENAEKVKALEIYDLPDKIIALIIGSTPNSVKSMRYQVKGSSKGNKKQIEHQTEVQQ